MEECLNDNHVDGPDSWNDVPRHLVPGPEGPGGPRPDPAADGARRDRLYAVWTTTAGHNIAFYVLQIATTMVLALAAYTAFADFPLVGELPGGDQAPARRSSRRADTAWFSRRHHRAVPGGGRPGRRVRRSTSPGSSRLRDRRLHLVHAFTGGHGQAPRPDQGTALASRPADQRSGSDRDGDPAGRHRDHQVHARGVGRDRARAHHGRRPDPAGAAVRGGTARTAAGPGAIQHAGPEAPRDRAAGLDQVDS